MKSAFECIDVDGLFEAYLRRWMKWHAGEFGSDVDRLEEQVPELYERFLAEPNDALDGLSPEAFFDRAETAEARIAWLEAYHAAGVPVPDPLLDRIARSGKDAEAGLCRIVSDPDREEALRMACISMLREMDSRALLPYYVRCVAETAAEDALAEAMAESLSGMGDEAVGPILDALPGSGEAGKDLFCDILAGKSGDGRISALLQERFRAHRGDCALFASYLSKHGDESAIPLLLEAAADPNVPYIDFEEIGNAIEALGGERPASHEFSGDPYYEALKRL